MSEQTLTLALNGDVPLGDFADAIRSFHELVRAISEEVAGGTEIIWTVDKLESGSAVATVRGDSRDAMAVEKVVRGFGIVGHALEAQTAIPYSLSVARPALQLTKLINGNITSIRFETQFEDVYVSAPRTDAPKAPPYPPVYGTIKGTVESLSRRRGIRFTIYDAIFDKPVSCYLEPEHEGDVRDFWGTKVFVSGRITRDSDTGKPIAVRRITEIRPARSSAPGSYRKARGVLRLLDGENPEQAVREGRDG